MQTQGVNKPLQCSGSVQVPLYNDVMLSGTEHQHLTTVTIVEPPLSGHCMGVVPPFYSQLLDSSPINNHIIIWHFIGRSFHCSLKNRWPFKRGSTVQVID